MMAGFFIPLCKEYPFSEFLAKTYILCK